MGFASRIFYLAFLSRISHFYLASRIFISHLAFFYLASRIFYLASRIFISHLAFFFSRISNYLSRIHLQNFFLLEISRISNVPYRLPYVCYNESRHREIRYVRNLIARKKYKPRFRLDHFIPGPTIFEKSVGTLHDVDEK